MQTQSKCIYCKRVLTFKEAAEYTGFSEGYLHQLTANQAIPFSKPNGKNIFFDRERLEEWLLSNPTEPKTSRTRDSIYPSNNNLDINNQDNNYSPTVPIVPPTQTLPPAGDARVGAGGSVGRSVGKPASRDEYDSFCSSAGMDPDSASALWRDLDFHGWELQQKDGSWKPVQDWRKFVKYRADMSSKEHHTQTPAPPDPEFAKDI